MIDPTTRLKLEELYPTLRLLPRELRDELVRSAQMVRASAGTTVFDERQQCSGFPMLLAGAIRVAKGASSGREILLYRVKPGESCILTSSCLLGHLPYSARGTAEGDLSLVMIDAALFARLLAAHEPFRAYVFALFGERVSELMQLVEAVAFQKLDQRLAALLLGKGAQIRTTHQALADELGSVREIITRLLRSFEDRGWVSLSREYIEIRDPAALRRVCTGDQ